MLDFRLKADKIWNRKKRKVFRVSLMEMSKWQYRENVQDKFKKWKDKVTEHAEQNINS